MDLEATFLEAERLDGPTKRFPGAAQMRINADDGRPVLPMLGGLDQPRSRLTLEGADLDNTASRGCNLGQVSQQAVLTGGRCSRNGCKLLVALTSQPAGDIP